MKVEHTLRVPTSPGNRHQQQQLLQRQRQAGLSEEGAFEPDTQVYGVSLDALMLSNGRYTLPRPIRECIAFINHHGLAAEGIFRRSPPSTALRAAKDGYNRNQAVDLSLAGVNVAAVLLKLFYRELPEPVFSSRNYEIVRALPASPPSETSGSNDVAKQMDSVRARYVEEVILPSLKAEYRVLLCFTFALLSVVARNENVNRMTAYNLAIVWAPNFARSSNPMLDVSMCAAGPGAATVGAVVQIMVQMFDKVFSHELRSILGADATDSSVDRAAAVLDVVDRMNSGQLDGIRLTPPRLPQRKAAPAAARPTPPLPPRRLSSGDKAGSSAEPKGTGMAAEDDDEDENGDEDDMQIFADAESESPSSLVADPVAVTKAEAEAKARDDGERASDAEDMVAESIETNAEPIQAEHEDQDHSQSQSNGESPPKDGADEAESKKSVESTDTKK